MTDIFDELFGTDVEEPEEGRFYPGSKRERRPKIEVERDDLWREDFAMKLIGGRLVPMYTIGALASALHVKPQTIRAWTRNGYIPQAPYRLPSTMVVKGENVAGRRLYTEELIDAIREVFEQHGLIDRQRINWNNHTSVAIEVSEMWTRIIRNSKQQPQPKEQQQ